MQLRTKFNLSLITVFVVGLLGAGYISYEILQKNAREEVIHNARIMMESALAVRGYTIKEIRPLLTLQLKRQFLPQSVPAYAATQSVAELRRKYPEYSYKEATLNPTNPASRATDWEEGIVRVFRDNPDQKELIGTRATPTGPALTLSRPIRVGNEGCLACHGTVDDAPETMLKLYGRANGFGWKLNEVVGSQIVSVPMSVPLKRARDTFYVFIGSLAAVFVGLTILINILLHIFVIKRINQISSIAHDVSMGRMDVPDITPKGKDEVASLGSSFNRMRRSLENAMQMLDS